MPATEYHLIQIIVIFTLIYLFSQSLISLNIITKALHNKIWNSVLLLGFLGTVIPGILLVLQNNYKIETSIGKNLLFYHVNIGIGLSVTGLFHILARYKFFARLFRMKTDIIDYEPIYRLPRRMVRLFIFTAGIISVIAQIVLLRENISIFDGNEWYTGIFLGNWTILSGLGAFAGRRSGLKGLSAKKISAILLIFSALPILTLFATAGLKGLFFATGVKIGLIEFFFYSLFVLLPFCFLSGYIFYIIATAFTIQCSDNRVSEVYGIESLGSFAGGLIFNFILVFFVSSATTLLILFSGGLFFFSRYIWRNSAKLKRSVQLIAILLIPFAYFIKLDNSYRSILFPGQQIIWNKNTLSGNMVLTQSYNQFELYENNVLINSNNDIYGHQSAIIPYLSNPDCKEVLLLGTATIDQLNTLIKLNVKNITIVNNNTHWIDLLKQNIELNKIAGKVKFIKADSRQYINKTPSKYDLIFIGLPGPKSLSLNRYYTEEFFASVKTTLSPKGMLVFSLPENGNYITNEISAMYASILNSLEKEFKHTDILPINLVYFFASENQFTNINHTIINAANQDKYECLKYTDSTSVSERKNEIISKCSNYQELNTDFYPLGFLWSQMFILKYQKIPKWIIYCFLGLLFLVTLIVMRSDYLGVFTAGFTGISLEIVLFFLFQLFWGYLYHASGLLIMFFMAGLAIGTYWSGKKQFHLIKFPIEKILLTLGISILLLIPLVFLIKTFEPGTITGTFIFSIIILLFSVQIGAVFHISSETKGNIYTKASHNYSVDLLGTALGAYLVTSVLIPMMGLYAYIIIIASINIFASGLIRIKHLRS